jgi:hypothetical protein
MMLPERCVVYKRRLSRALPAQRFRRDRGCRAQRREKHDDAEANYLAAVMVVTGLRFGKI